MRAARSTGGIGAWTILRSARGDVAASLSFFGLADSSNRLMAPPPVEGVDTAEGVALAGAVWFDSAVGGGASVDAAAPGDADGGLAAGVSAELDAEPDIDGVGGTAADAAVVRSLSADVPVSSRVFAQHAKASVQSKPGHRASLMACTLAQ